MWAEGGGHSGDLVTELAMSHEVVEQTLSLPLQRREGRLHLGDFLTP